PFTRETAMLKVRAAENNWNTRIPEKVAQGYTVDSRWRNRSEFISGRDEIISFLTRKWSKELEYRLIKELWLLTTEGLRCGLRMNRTTHLDNGSAHTEMKCGNSMPADLCSAVTPASMMLLSKSRIDSIVGRWARVRKGILA